MPPKGKKKNFKPKRKFYKKKNNRYFKKPTNSVVKSLVLHSPFPAHYFCTMKYSHTSLLSVGTSGIYGTEQVFRTSLYDPDFTGSGHQPYSRDQIAQIWNKYTIYGVHIHIEVTDPSEDGLVVAMMLQPSGSSYTITGKTIDEIKEKTNGYTVNINNTGSQTAKVDQYMDVAKIEGVSKSKIMNDDLYSSAMSTNPSLTPYFRVAVGNLRGSGSGTVIVRTLLTFYVKCYDLIIQGQS